MKLLMDRGGLYDRGKDLRYKYLKDLSYIAAMGKAGGGRNEVDPRFVSLFNVFNMPFPATESLQRIYTSILEGHAKVSTARSCHALTPPPQVGAASDKPRRSFQSFSEDIMGICDKITNCTLELYNTIIKEMPPTPSKFHYIFNLRDLSRVYNGLVLTSPKRSAGWFHARVTRLVGGRTCFQTSVFLTQNFHRRPVRARLEKRVPENLPRQAYR